ncbi:MAG: glycosyltransferase family 2 protein [Pseudobacter sp.]|uniref:glycosyltransferase family 2 protein n=1 Tax=Pseudobacter sp. TaxID=2045420 RepID=UPI003F80057E
MSIVASIVIPTFKRPGLLIKCLQALVDQSVSHKAYEIIVITDGPDAETFSSVNKLKMAYSHTPQITVLTLPEHRGPAAARNAGWKAAEGRLVIFTDDDCHPSHGFVEAYLKYFRQQAREHIAFTGKLLVPVPQQPTDYQKNIAQLQQASFVTANCAISRSALEKTGGFDEDFTMAWREDSAMEFELLKQAIPVRYVPEALVVHPVRKVSWGVSLKIEKKNMFNALLYRKHCTMYKEKIRSRPPLIYYCSLISASGLLAAAALPASLFYASLFMWTGTTGILAGKRLRGTSKKPSHVFEMIITSMFIPALSVFWNTYGCIRYKRLLL